MNNLTSRSEIAKLLFEDSMAAFFAAEAENIASNISERNLCGRLSIYLTKKFWKYGVRNYYADIEYNRKQGGRVKTILDNDFKEIVIQADLIVHTRGKLTMKDNMLAIELKKSSRPNSEKISDRLRLMAMTKESYDNIWSADGITHPEYVCGYELGIYIILNPKTKSYSIEYYESGNLAYERIGSF